MSVRRLLGIFSFLIILLLILSLSPSSLKWPDQQVLPTLASFSPDGVVLANPTEREPQMLETEEVAVAPPRAEEINIDLPEQLAVAATDFLLVLPTEIPLKTDLLVSTSSTLPEHPTSPDAPQVINRYSSQVVEDQVVIHFAPNATTQGRVDYIESIGGTVYQTIAPLDTVVVYVSAPIAALPASSIVAETEPDYYVTALLDYSVPTSDPYYPDQWALPVISAPEAWLELPADAPQVTVAVIDSGICLDHPDLAGRILAGYDFLEDDSTPQDELGHGCGVAGIIAANVDNGIGIAGVAPNAQIMPLRVLDASGVGTYSDVAAAIVYAVDNGAEIINLSLGGSNASSLLENAVNYAVSHDVTVVAAAGNTGDTVLYPAKYESVIAVGSLDQNLQASNFSANGPEIDVWMPGRDILITMPNGGYVSMSGTSFAAPYASGQKVLELVGVTISIVTGPPVEPEIPISTDENTGPKPLPLDEQSPLRIMVPYENAIQQLDALSLAQRFPNLDIERSFSPGPRMEAAVDPNPPFKMLAILVDFSDNTATVSSGFYDSLLFGTTQPSIQHYYNEVSYSQLDIVSVSADEPGSLGWRRAPQTYAYYAGSDDCMGSYPTNCQKLTEDLVAQIDSLVDFSQYDNDGDGYVDTLFVIHAGAGAETGANGIWSHSWWTATQALVDGVRVGNYVTVPEYRASPGDSTIGVFVHELGHAFGLPDLYDIDYTSAGIGNWSLMAGGSWNGSGGTGSTPAYLDAWSRLFLEWTTAVEVTSTSQAISIPNVEQNSSNSIYRLSNPSRASEYFLFENRQAVGYDVALPGFGLLIWHVDEGVLGSNRYECEQANNWLCTQHYRVALEQADGLLELENNIDEGDSGDPFPGSTNKTSFNFATNPNTSSYYSSTDPGILVSNISISSNIVYVTLGISFTPPNDNFSSLTVIPSLSYTDNVNTANASNEVNDPTPSCGTGAGKTVWYSYTPASNQDVIFDTIGSTFNTVLSIWTGTEGNLVEQGCNDDSSGLQSQIDISVTGGTTYYIMVGGYNGASGNLVLNALVFAGNDNFNSPTIISSLPYTDSISTLQATDAVDDPTPLCAPVGMTVWYSYTPLSNQAVTFDTIGSDFDTVLSIWTGTQGNLVEQGCNDDIDLGVDLQSQVNISLTGGTTYYIMVGGWGGDSGNLILNAVSTSAPSTAEKNALIALYNSSNGAGWNNKTNWLVSSNACTWYGVICDASGHVVSLILVSNNLVGTIPTGIGNLIYLTELNLGTNQLSGSIPSQIANLISMQYLYLPNNQLTGSIPTGIGNLTQLVHLWLESNLLTGSIPTGLANASNLDYFNLRDNNLTGSIPTGLANLSNLGVFDLAWNQLDGSIPTGFGNATGMYAFYVVGNNLTGTIPTDLATLTDLYTFDIAWNQLEGTIPVGFGDAVNMQSFSIGGNNLTGTIPTDLATLTNLNFFHIGWNQLEDAIPTGFGNASNLQYFYVSGNQLTGTIPVDLGNASNLQYFYANSNQLTGSIPSELGNLSNLVSLNLSENQLSGEIPASLGNLTNLLTLDLSHNALNGEIPSTITNLVNLNLGQYDYTDIAYNRFISSNSTVIAFMDAKSPGWNLSQTILPGNVQITNTASRRVTVSWDGIPYTADGGYYETLLTEITGEPYELSGCNTADKTETSCEITGLTPETTYYIVVRTFTPAHDVQQNDLLSEFSLEVQATTPPSTTGFVQGTVYESNGTTPISTTAWVDALEASTGNWIAGVQVQPDGTYELELEAGTYRLQSAAYNHAAEFYDNAAQSFDLATDIVVTIDGTATGIDFSLDAGASISGIVRDTQGNPIPNINVYITNIWNSACTDANGLFTIYNIPLNHPVQVGAAIGGNWCGGSEAYVTEWWSESPYEEGATSIILTSQGQNYANVNFTLELGGIISGTVYEADGVTPIMTQAWVNAENATTGNWVGGNSANGDGTYEVLLAPGTYRLHSSAVDHTREYYDNVEEFDPATTITVTAGNIVADIDFSLDPGGSLSGVVRDTLNNPLPNINVGIADTWNGTCTDQNGAFTLYNIALNTPVQVNAAGGDNWCGGSSSYLEEWWQESPDINTATDITLTTGGQNYLNVNFTLELGGSISGTVKATENNNPLANIWVCAFTYDASAFDLATWQCTQTQANGTYLIDKIEAVEQRVWIFPDDRLRLFYNQSITFEGATPVSIISGQETSGINFSLARASIITGTVYDQDGVTPLSGVTISTADGQYVECSQDDGSYHIFVPVGTYLVKASSGVCNSGAAFYPQYYNLALDLADAIPIVIGRTGLEIVNIDFVLQWPAPMGSMTSPVRGSHQRGPIIPLTVNALDLVSGMDYVNFYYWNGAEWIYLNTDSSEPFAYDWDIENPLIPEGFYWVSAMLVNTANESTFLWGDEEWTFFWLDRTAPVSQVESLTEYSLDTIIVNWSGSDNNAGTVISYDIQYQVDCTGSWLDWLVGVTTQEADFGGDLGTLYCFRSRATDSADNVEAWPAEADTSTTLALPEPLSPSHFRISPATDGLHLLWTNEEPSYDVIVVQRSSDGGTIWQSLATLPAGTREYLDNTAICEVDYIYQLIVERYIDGRSSQPVSAIAENTLCVPYNLSIVGTTSDSISLNWQSDATQSTEYLIESSPSEAGLWNFVGVVPITTTEYTEIDLTCGTNRYYRIRTYSATLNTYSAPSMVISGSTLACPTLPIPPAPVIVDISRSSVSLQMAGDASGKVSNYRLHRSRDAGSSWQEVAVLPASGGNYVDEPLACGTSYDYRIVAYRASDQSYSGPSAITSIVTDPCPPPNVNTVGLYRDGQWMFRDANASGPPDVLFQFGPNEPGWQALVGDWDGDGVDGIGLYHNGTFILRNISANGPIDIIFTFGTQEAGWQAVVGDWNGDDVDSAGIYRNGQFYLRNSHSHGSPDYAFTLGYPQAGWQAIAGDWDGNGTDSVGVYRPNQWYLSNYLVNVAVDYAFMFGDLSPDWRPVAGDWDGNGIDSIGLYRIGIWYLRNSSSSGAPDVIFNFGQSNGNWLPVASYRGGLEALSLLASYENISLTSATATVPASATPIMTQSATVPASATALPELTADVSETLVVEATEAVTEATLAPEVSDTALIPTGTEASSLTPAPDNTVTTMPTTRIESTEEVRQP